jgi:Putative beta-barrel porin-2, OmpL-like. bbp2
MIAIDPGSRVRRATGSFLLAAGVVAASSAPVDASAQLLRGDTTVKLTFGAFVDGYYAWDFNQPTTIDRSFFGDVGLFTTQPSRHDEFNVNLVFGEAKLESRRFRARFALQAGTSVQNNYSGEPTIGQVSGPLLSRIIQEATAGIKVGSNLWVDGGIFFSNAGMEGWISRDNPTYTRSLVADYSPYYSSGVRAIWQASSTLAVRVDVVNGWQNISENNSGKGAGVRMDYSPTANATISYYDLFSDEAGNRLRTFNGVGAKAAFGATTILGEYDIGTQSHSASSDGTASWYGFTFIARQQVTRLLGVSGRFERYSDPSQVIIVTGVTAVPIAAFLGNGVSAGIDVQPLPGVLWRSEIRGFTNKYPVFPNHKIPEPKKTDGFVVSSLALTF